MTNFLLETSDLAVVVGAGQGIGLGLVEKLLASQPRLTIVGTYRDPNRAQGLFDLKERYVERLVLQQADPCDETDVAELASLVGKQDKRLHLLINSVGYLHDDQRGPEKSLKDIDVEHLQKYFLVNAIVTPLLAKHFLGLFRHKDLSCFVSLSAKVGSITDNSLGGWYGYRASKSALNMFLKNISIELTRRGCKTIVLSIHPGTTKTELSKPFISKSTKLQLHEPIEAATNILSVIQGRAITDGGEFYSWNGEKLPW